MLPANFGSYSFWTETDPERKASLRREFLKDLSLVGGLMIAAADTAVKSSLGWRGRRAAERLSDRVSSALPGSDDAFDADLGERIAHGLHVGAERGAPYAEAALDLGRELVSIAAERSTLLAKKARKRGEKLAEELAEKTEKARQRSEELANAARERVAAQAKTPRAKLPW